MHSTDKCNLPRTEPPECVHCGEGHPANYRGCKVYQEIIGNRFPSSKPITNNHRSATTATQENLNPVTPKQNGIRPGITYAQITKNDQVTSICSPNTQGDTLSKIMPDYFMRFEAILMKKAEQMSSLMNLLTTVLSKLVNDSFLQRGCMERERTIPTHKRSRNISQYSENWYLSHIRNSLHSKKLHKTSKLHRIRYQTP
jgi:hypothetical protein